MSNTATTTATHEPRRSGSRAFTRIVLPVVLAGGIGLAGGVGYATIAHQEALISDASPAASGHPAKTRPARPAPVAAATRPSGSQTAHADGETDLGAGSGSRADAVPTTGNGGSGTDTTADEDTAGEQSAADTEAVTTDESDTTTNTVTGRGVTPPAPETETPAETPPAATVPAAPSLAGPVPAGSAPTATRIDENHTSLNYVPEQVPSSSSTGATDGYPQTRAQSQHYEQQAKITQSIQDTITCTIGCVRVVGH
ncbi:hypothetical protein [Actinomycetospora sp. CA-084318]|uniref:hypothetical protein n=1 Tax=Actinomycetospora sp. CA-084318 TaxID=3239892 RepID=UPI003D980E6D